MIWNHNQHVWRWRQSLDDLSCSWNSRDTHGRPLCSFCYILCFRLSVFCSPIPGEKGSNQLKAFIKVMDIICAWLGRVGGWREALKAASPVDGCFINTSVYQGRGFKVEIKSFVKNLKFPTKSDPKAVNERILCGCSGEVWQRPRKLSLWRFVVRFNQRKAISLTALKATGIWLSMGFADNESLSLRKSIPSFAASWDRKNFKSFKFFPSHSAINFSSLRWQLRKWLNIMNSWLSRLIQFRALWMLTSKQSFLWWKSEFFIHPWENNFESDFWCILRKFRCYFISLPQSFLFEMTFREFVCVMRWIYVEKSFFYLSQLLSLGDENRQTTGVGRRSSTKRQTFDGNL